MRKNFRGLGKYRKGVDHRKGGGSARRGGGCKVVPSYDIYEKDVRIFIFAFKLKDILLFIIIEGSVENLLKLPQLLTLNGLTIL